MKAIRRLKRWCRGLGHLRGFGIQSPFAYSLVRNVFGEKAPYYKYVELDLLYPNISYNERKFGRLLFRLANYLQAHTFYVDPVLDSFVFTFLQAGAQQSRKTEKATDAAFCVLSSGNESALHDFLLNVKETDVLVLNDIYVDGRPSAQWSHLLAFGNVKVTFDFYSFGVVFFHSSLQRKDYLLNF